MFFNEVAINYLVSKLRTSPSLTSLSYSLFFFFLVFVFFLS